MNQLSNLGLNKGYVCIAARAFWISFHEFGVEL
jgi:hypothetical protein